jgi:CRISPR-associated endonuclease/helicase Cas3
VLWVVNTVDRCQRAADELAAVLGHDVLVYHSRFCLRDRQQAHERTVAAFQQSERAALAVTTQVCEMSLDLDADVLVTELAPVTSLVQRFGRSNRSPSRPAGFRARVLWYAPEQALPYQRPELEAGLAFLGELDGREVSQRALCEALERHAPEGPRVRDAARFLDAGYYATPGSLREEAEHTRPAVLDDQLDAVLEARRRGRSIDGFVLPVPRRWVRDQGDDPRAAELPRYLGLAPGDCYSATRGFVAPAREMGAG